MHDDARVPHTFQCRACTSPNFDTAVRISQSPCRPFSLEAHREALRRSSSGCGGNLNSAAPAIGSGGHIVPSNEIYVGHLQPIFGDELATTLNGITA